MIILLLYILNLLASKLENLNVLLPLSFTSSHVQYNLHIYGEQCQDWESTSHIIKLDYSQCLKNNCDDQKMSINLNTNKYDEQIVKVYSLSTKQQFNVKIGMIKNIQIDTQFHNLDIGNVYVFQISGYDEQKNKFSSLQGINFIWEFNENCLEPIPYNQSDKELHSYYNNLDFQGDLIIFKAKNYCDTQIKATLNEKDQEKISDAIKVQIKQQFEISPNRDLFILVNQKIDLQLFKVIGQQKELNYDQQVQIEIKEPKFCSLNDNLITGKQLGETQLVVNDKQNKIKTNMNKVYVVKANRISSQILNSSSNLILGNKYQVKFVILSNEDQNIYVTENLIDIKWPEQLENIKYIENGIYSFQVKNLIKPLNDLYINFKYQKLSNTLKVNIHEQVDLLQLNSNEKINIPFLNKVLQYKINPIGGTGKYQIIPMTENIKINNNQIQTLNEGEAIFKIIDSMNEENFKEIKVNIINVNEKINPQLTNKTVMSNGQIQLKLEFEQELNDITQFNFKDSNKNFEIKLEQPIINDEIKEELNKYSQKHYQNQKTTISQLTELYILQNSQYVIVPKDVQGLQPLSLQINDDTKFKEQINVIKQEQDKNLNLLINQEYQTQLITILKEIELKFNSEFIQATRDKNKVNVKCLKQNKQNLILIQQKENGFEYNQKINVNCEELDSINFNVNGQNFKNKLKLLKGKQYKILYSILNQIHQINQDQMQLNCKSETIQCEIQENYLIITAKESNSLLIQNQNFTQEVQVEVYEKFSVSENNIVLMEKEQKQINIINGSKNIEITKDLQNASLDVKIENNSVFIKGFKIGTYNIQLIDQIDGNIQQIKVKISSLDNIKISTQNKYKYYNHQMTINLEGYTQEEDLLSLENLKDQIQLYVDGELTKFEKQGNSLIFIPNSFKQSMKKANIQVYVNENVKSNILNVVFFKNIKIDQEKLMIPLKCYSQVQLNGGILNENDIYLQLMYNKQTIEAELINQTILKIQLKEEIQGQEEIEIVVLNNNQQIYSHKIQINMIQIDQIKIFAFSKIIGQQKELKFYAHLFNQKEQINSFCNYDFNWSSSDKAEIVSENGLNQILVKFNELGEHKINLKVNKLEDNMEIKVIPLNNQESLILLPPNYTYDLQHDPNIEYSLCDCTKQIQLNNNQIQTHQVDNYATVAIKDQYQNNIGFYNFQVIEISILQVQNSDIMHNLQLQQEYQFEIMLKDKFSREFNRVSQQFKYIISDNIANIKFSQNTMKIYTNKVGSAQVKVYLMDNDQIFDQFNIVINDKILNYQMINTNLYSKIQMKSPENWTSSFLNIENNLIDCDKLGNYVLSLKHQSNVYKMEINIIEIQRVSLIQPKMTNIVRSHKFQESYDIIVELFSQDNQVIKDYENNQYSLYSNIEVICQDKSNQIQFKSDKRYEKNSSKFICIAEITDNIYQSDIDVNIIAYSQQKKIFEGSSKLNNINRKMIVTQKIYRLTNVIDIYINSDYKLKFTCYDNNLLIQDDFKNGQYILSVKKIQKEASGTAQILVINENIIEDQEQIEINYGAEEQSSRLIDIIGIIIAIITIYLGYVQFTLKRN